MKIWEYIKGVFWIFGVPILLYLLIIWDPVLGKNEDGEPNRLGYWFVVIPYLIALFFIHKYRSEKNEFKWYLKRLLDEKTTLEEQREIKEELRKREILGKL